METLPLPPISLDDGPSAVSFRDWILPGDGAWKLVSFIQVEAAGVGAFAVANAPMLVGEG